MRQIKFRAWREKDYNGKFQVQRGMYQVGNLPLWSLAEHEFGIEIYVKHIPETRYTDRNVMDYKLMQFTGLLDKNGKEIYEGDLLDTYGEVKFENGEFVAKGVGLRTINKTREVTGNIYEN